MIGYRRIKIIIFDCDGVLFDSRKANYEYYNKICRLCGREPMSQEEFLFVHMHTAQDSLRFLFRDRPDLLDRAFSVVGDVSYGEFIRYMRFDPTLPYVLSELKKMGLFLAISTNRGTTIPLLKRMFRLDRWFDYVCSAMDVKYPKPHPEGVKKILGYFRLDPGKAVYIGDSKVDEIVAKRVNIPFVSYKNPSLNAMFHVKHFYELLRFTRCVTGND